MTDKNLPNLARPRCFIHRFFTSLTIIALLCAASFVAPAQDSQRTKNASPIANDARINDVALYQALLDLSNPFTVMCVAAHPDDEDGATLTILRRKYGAHTVSLFSTYGEGGQNAVGPELYEELGAIRARETMEAAEVQGSEPYFLALRDFGFSKSADETFRIWNRDEALRRMVYQIRRLRPDVIITNHDTVSGHGQHQATGRLLLEAFDAAADPARFPEQLHEGGKEARVGTWQPQRLFVRTGFDGGAGSKQPEDGAQQANAVISYDANELDPVRNQTYAEQALQALRHHATQGPWPQKLPAGPRIIRYRLARAAKDAAPFPANAKTFLDGLHLPEAIAARLATPTIDGRPLLDFVNERGRVLEALVAARKRLDLDDTSLAENSSHFVLMKGRLFHALAAASGVTVTVTPQDKVLVPKTSTNFLINISNKGELSARPFLLSFNGTASGVGKVDSLAPGASVNIIRTYETPARALISTPHAEHLYDGHLFGEEFDVSALVEVEGAQFMIPAETRVDVAPAVEITNIAPSPFILTPLTLTHPPSFAFQLVNHLPMPSIIRIDAKSSTYSMNIFSDGLTLKANEVRNVMQPFGYLTSTAYVATGKSLRPVSDTVTFTIHRSFNTGELITQKVIKVVYSDAHVAPNLRVGYVRSTDETLRNALAALGVESKELTIDDVHAGDLSRYDTIIIDNRGYEAHPELIASNGRLLDYARAGGNLIVFYHKSFEWNPDPQKNRPQLAPYPILLGNERITDENAPVTFLEPANALLNFPNKITQDDFTGWIQERGLYYPKQWDAHYTALLAANDPNESPLKGGLLAADYGRGHYIYTSMVWYRQLRAGIPGAYRIFANMISYGHAKGSYGAQ